MSRCRGGYAVTIAINGYGILAFRDPHGVRPLCLGVRPGWGGADSGIAGSGGAAAGRISAGEVGADGRVRGSGKMDLAVASESAALTGLGFSLKGDVTAGEAVFLDVNTGAVTSQSCCDEGGLAGDARFKPCLFEYVYMARPDSVIDGVSVSYFNFKGQVFFVLCVCVSSVNALAS